MQQPNAKLPVHNVSCTLCLKKPIQGYLYVCSTKNGIYLCSECFNTKREQANLLQDGFAIFYQPGVLHSSIEPQIAYKHKGTKCYGCKVHPIEGKRFSCKTKKLDLCEKCFNQRGKYNLFGQDWDIMVIPNMISGSLHEKGVIPEHKTKCCGCSKKPIYGRLFHCSNKKGIDLCELCFNDREKLGYIGYNWIVYSQPGYIESNVNEFVERHKINCSYCNANPILGRRFKCLTKKGFNLCEGCFARRKEFQMSNHNWSVYSAPKVISENINEQFLVVHPIAKCDGCKMKPIAGPRYSIVGKDYDLCHTCFDKRKEFEKEGKYAWDVFAAPGICVDRLYDKEERFFKKCSNCKTKPIVGMMYECLTKKGKFCQECFSQRFKFEYYDQNWVVYRSPGVEERRIYEMKGVHKVKCTGCKTKPIIGKKYACQSKSATLCEGCFQIRNRLGLGREKWKVFPIAGAKYADKIDEKLYRQTGIRCDGCKKKSFVGPRFKCLSRKDFDLCSECFNTRWTLNPPMWKGHSWVVVMKPETISKGLIINPPTQPPPTELPPQQQQQQQNSNVPILPQNQLTVTVPTNLLMGNVNEGSNNTVVEGNVPTIPTMMNQQQTKLVPQGTSLPSL